MAIYIGECEAKLYKGNYESAALYKGDVCIIPKENIENTTSVEE